MAETEYTYLSAQEAAEYLGLGYSTLAQMRMKGEGPPHMMLGARVKYRRDQLDVWAAAQAVQTEDKN